MLACRHLTTPLCGLLLITASAQARAYNVSDPGARHPGPPPMVSFQPQQNCATACTCAMASVADISNACATLPHPLRTDAWPPQFGTAPPAVPTKGTYR